jgi:hypothetical protein
MTFVAVLLALVGCKEERPPPDSVDGGQGGEGGCPVRPPEPLFVLDIRTDDGPVPLDTSVSVEWSAGVEPKFVLSDTSTWKTLDDGVNLVCRVDREKPPPVDLSALVCEVWASGAVNVHVEATGYEPHVETLKTVMSELCGGPMPMEVAVMLTRAKMDAGPPP